MVIAATNPSTPIASNAVDARRPMRRSRDEKPKRCRYRSWAEMDASPPAWSSPPQIQAHRLQAMQSTHADRCDALDFQLKIRVRAAASPRSAAPAPEERATNNIPVEWKS